MSNDFVVAISSDHAGFFLKDALVAYLVKVLGAERVMDLGPADATRCDYPDKAALVAHAIQDGKAQFGVLVCGSGIGISMAANKHNGIRAALCHDVTTARLCRQHNDANVICLGARIIGEGVACDAIDAFLSASFEGGRHTGRIEKMAEIERSEKARG